MVLFFFVLYFVSDGDISLPALCIGAIATYAIVSGVIFLASNIPFLAEVIGMDVLGNITVVISLSVFSFSITRNILLSIFYSLFAAIISMIGNTAAGLPVFVLLNADVGIARYSIALYLIIAAITFPLCYVLARYVGKIFRQTSSYLSFEVKDKYVLYCLVLSVITYILSLLNIFAHRVIADYNLLSSINIILITTVFFVAIYVMSAYSATQQKMLAKELKIKAQKDLEDYVQHLGEAHEEMRSFRHDHINLLHTIMGYAEEGKQAELKEFLVKKMDYSVEALRLLDSSLDKLKYIHVPELRGLLWVKFAHALEHGISLEIDITKPVKDFSISTLDLCRFIGIIVDNAMEELQLSSYSNKTMKFGIIIDDDTEDVLVICSNPCMVMPDFESLFSMGFSTKDRKRGMGLYSLKKYCDKHQNVFVTTRYHDNNFSIILTIGQV